MGTEVMEVERQTREGAYWDGPCLHLVKMLSYHEWS